MRNLRLADSDFFTIRSIAVCQLQWIQLLKSFQKIAFGIGSGQVLGQKWVRILTLSNREESLIARNSTPLRHMLMWLTRLLPCILPKHWHHLIRKRALYAGWLFKGQGTLRTCVLRCFTTEDGSQIREALASSDDEDESNPTLAASVKRWWTGGKMERHAPLPRASERHHMQAQYDLPLE